MDCEYVYKYIAFAYALIMVGWFEGITYMYCIHG